MNFFMNYLQPIDIDHKALGFSTSRLGQSFKTSFMYNKQYFDQNETQ